MGENNIVLTPHEPKIEQTISESDASEPVTKAANADESEASTKLESIASAENSGPREVELEDNVLLRISFDKGSGRFVYFGVDKETGDVVSQYPSERVLKLLAENKVDTAGLILDEKI